MARPDCSRQSVVFGGLGGPREEKHTKYVDVSELRDKDGDELLLDDGLLMEVADVSDISNLLSVSLGGLLRVVDNELVLADALLVELVNELLVETADDCIRNLFWKYGIRTSLRVVDGRLLLDDELLDDCEEEEEELELELLEDAEDDEDDEYEDCDTEKSFVDMPLLLYVGLVGVGFTSISGGGKMRSTKSACCEAEPSSP